MTSVYKPRGPYDSLVDPNRCKSDVHHRDRMLGFYQCRRKPWKDGWCKQHHPDAEAKRQAERALRWERKQARSPHVRLGKAREEIVRLKARIAELEGEQT